MVVRNQSALRASPASSQARTSSRAVQMASTPSARSREMASPPGSTMRSNLSLRSVTCHERPADPTGTVAGFADARGEFLPLVCTLNAARVLDAAAAMLGVDHHQLSELALAAPPGSDGLVLVPYLDGERTPNLPRATGSLHGLTRHNMTAGHVARAAVEGMLCGLAQGLEAMSASGPQPTSVMLIGGASTSEAVRRIAPTVFGLPVVIPSASEYVADGAARQAAWALEGAVCRPCGPTPLHRRRGTTRSRLPACANAMRSPPHGTWKASESFHVPQGRCANGTCRASARPYARRTRC